MGANVSSLQQEGNGEEMEEREMAAVWMFTLITNVSRREGTRARYVCVHLSPHMEGKILCGCLLFSPQHDAACLFSNQFPRVLISD